MRAVPTPGERVLLVLLADWVQHSVIKGGA